MDLFDYLNEPEEDLDVVQPMSSHETAAPDLQTAYQRILAEEEQERLEAEQAATAAKQAEATAAAEDGGILTDIGHGTMSGVVRGGEMLAGAAEWVAPEGTGVENAADEVGNYLKTLRVENPDWFAESKSSMEAREGSAWDPRGWLYGGFESLGMLAPGMAAGAAVTAAAPVVGVGAAAAATAGSIASAGVVGSQFWGGTAQESYDEVEENERQGIGKKLTEKEKVIYANVRGFWEGGVEMIQSRLPFMKLGKFIPKAAKQNIVRAAVTRPGNPLFNSAKGYLKVIATEVPMEIGQEYAGLKTAHEFGQSELDPGWDDVKGVIGATIVMSAVLGTASQTKDAMGRKNLHDALTKDDVTPETRIAAIKAVYAKIKSQDKELADMWLEQTQKNLDAGRPVALPLDEEIRQGGAVDAPADDSKRLPEALKQAEAEAATPEQQAEQMLDEQLDAAETGNRQKQAEIDAREEALADQDVIEPELEDAPKTVKNYDDDIRNLENDIEKEPKHPMTEQRQVAVNALRLERAKLLNAEKTAEDTKQSTAAATLSEAEKVAPADTEALDTAAHEAATSPLNDKPLPSEKQLEQGDYEKGYVTVQGMEVSIENPVGSTREGTSDTGKKWSNTMDHHYGYIERVDGADGGNLDVYLGAKAEDTTQDVFVVNQVNPETGEFDEHKVMMGFESQAAAEKAYLGEYEAGWKGLGDIQSMTSEQFKAWKDGDLTVPADSKTLETKAGSKYSTKSSKTLNVDVDAIPKGLEVVTTVTSVQNGATVETSLDAKKAFKSVDALATKLESILECVAS